VAQSAGPEFKPQYHTHTQKKSKSNLTPVILATWEAKNRRITVQGQSGQKVTETPSQPIARHGGMCLSFQAMQQTEIGRTAVLGQSRGKKLDRPHLNRKKVERGCHIPVIPAIAGSIK
jgi:hypothetical protein